ncbi:hypothetical protein ACWEGE_21420 [Amycolatopsis sp. NPDC004747]
MSKRGRRAWWVAGSSVGGGVVLWAALRFGVPAWMSDRNHPARLVVEALSWVAGVAGFVVALAALLLTQRQAKEAPEAGRRPERITPAPAEKFRSVFVNSEGIQVGDHNNQRNCFLRRNRIGRKPG